MHTFIFAALAILSLIVTGNLTILGCDWITVGYGLNPWVAFPGAILCAAMSIWATRVLVKDH